MSPKRKVGRPVGSKTKKGRKSRTIKKKTIKSKRTLKEIHSKSSNDEQDSNEPLDISDIMVKSEFGCVECTKKFRFQKSFAEHLYKEHSKLRNSVKCEKCPVRCPNKKILNEHIKKFHDRDLFLCPNCNKEFVRQAHVVRHLAHTCEGNHEPSLAYECEVCNAKFSRKDNLLSHMRKKHIFKKEYECKHCTYGTNNFSKLTIHWQKKHAENSNQFHCDLCGRITNSKNALIKHMEIHGEKKFACEICDYKTHTIEVLRRHTFCHVRDKPHKCGHCTKSFSDSHQLKRHKQSKHGEQLALNCSKCDETFNSTSRLLVHMHKHHSEGKLNCPNKNCPYSTKVFDSEKSLEQHMQECVVYQFICEICSKKFQSESVLRHHLGTHALEKPRRCMYCVIARAYVRGEQLIKHIRKAHPAVFNNHLKHVREVMGRAGLSERVTKSEIESILNLLDAETDHILEMYEGSGALYGGVQEVTEPTIDNDKKTDSPLMSEQELCENIKLLLSQLIDEDTLKMLGWPEESVDVLLEKVIENCGARPADREKWTRVQRLRENSKYLFVHVVEDDKIANIMLNTQTIDQVIKNIVQRVTED